MPICPCGFGVVKEHSSDIKIRQTIFIDACFIDPPPSLNISDVLGLKLNREIIIHIWVSHSKFGLMK